MVPAAFIRLSASITRVISEFAGGFFCLGTDELMADWSLYHHLHGGYGMGGWFALDEADLISFGLHHLWATTQHISYSVLIKQLLAR